MRTRKTFRAAAIGLPLLAASAPSHAQNALGDGTALDRNLMSGSGGRNFSRPDFAAEIRFRNAIVTGNAPGGLSFRGDAGYADAFDFRGDLSSDSQFAFRRDSLYSGLAGLGIRGTEALQYQMALLTGDAPPSSLVGPMAVRRLGDSAPGPRPPGGPLSNRDLRGEEPLYRPDPADPSTDARGLALWTLRSTAGYTATRSLEPAVIDLRAGEDGNAIATTASSLRGLKPVSVPVPDAPAAPPGQVLIARPRSTAYDSITQRLNTYAAQQAIQAGAPVTTKPAWEARLEELREQLDAPTTTPAPSPPPGGAAPAAENVAQPPPAPPSAEDLRVTPDPALERLFRREAVEMLREGSGTVESLTPQPAGEGDAPSAYAAQMAQAEGLLRSGRYFDAEGAFTRALALQPGDPLASVGRIHAQIGAGMYLSAAVNLRKLFEDHPELVGVRYSPDLLPRPDRLDAVAVQLRELAAGETDRPRMVGGLLAYLGYQRGTRDDLEHGLALLRAAGPAPGIPLEQMDAEERLVRLLIEVWSPAEDAGAPDGQ